MFDDVSKIMKSFASALASQVSETLAAMTLIQPFGMPSTMPGGSDIGALNRRSQGIFP